MAWTPAFPRGRKGAAGVAPPFPMLARWPFSFVLCPKPTTKNDSERGEILNNKQDTKCDERAVCLDYLTADALRSALWLFFISSCSCCDFWSLSFVLTARGTRFPHSCLHSLPPLLSLTHRRFPPLITAHGPADFGDAPDVEMETLSPLGLVLGKKASARRVSAREHDLACLRATARWASCFFFFHLAFLRSTARWALHSVFFLLLFSSSRASAPRPDGRYTLDVFFCFFS